MTLSETKHSMMTCGVTLAAVAVVLLLCACGDDDAGCPAGFVADGDSCVLLDGGPVDTGPDASPDAPDMTIGDAGPDAADAGDDAGPCGMECTGETPLCDTAAMMCVQCLAPSDCSGAADMCEAGTCVECTNNTHCTTAEASLCTAEMSCGACTMNADCAGIMDGATALNVCDTSGAAGVCVQCISDADCGGNSCNPASNRCTETPLASRNVCQTCVSDTECAAGLGCVPMTFRGEVLPGGYCLTIATLDPCERPYLTGIEGRTSLSGVSDQDYCGINETLARCEAVLALVGDGMCPGGMDSECPGDGLCRRVGQRISTGTGGAANRCTYECSRARECDDMTANPDGSTCGTGYMPMAGDVSFCGGGRP